MINKKHVTIIFIILLVIGLVVAGYYASYPKDTIEYSLAIGVVASLITSLVYGGIVYFIYSEPASERKRIKELLDELSERELKGIKTIREKYSFDPNFWFSVLDASTEGIDMIGHALSTWCEHPYKNKFETSIEKIAKAGGKVRICILDETCNSHKRRKSNIGKNYSDKITITKSFIKRIKNNLPDSKKENLQLRLISDIDLPYMLINTGKDVIVSPYLAKTDSRDNILLIFERGNKFSEQYLNDFERIFNDANLYC